MPYHKQARHPRQRLNPFEHAQHFSAAPSGSCSKIPSSSSGSGKTCTVLILMFAQPIGFALVFSYIKNSCRAI